MVIVTDNSVLVLIDIQKAFAVPQWGKRNNPDAEKVAGRMMEEFRKHGRRVIHVRHESLNPDSLFRQGKSTFEFRDECIPGSGEIIITKHVNSAFIGTNLESKLREMNDPVVYFAGLVTDHCVSTTARMAGNLGFKIYVIEDACATFERKDHSGEVLSADIVHRANLASIDNEFGTVVNSSDIIFQPN